MVQIMLINFIMDLRDIVQDNLILFVLQMIHLIYKKEFWLENYKKDGLDGGVRQHYLWIIMIIHLESYFLLI